MGKTILGYTQGKLETKAAKRGVSAEAYLWYLKTRAKFRSQREKPEKL